MAFCLTADQKQKFKKSLKNREIDPVHLAKMDSQTRRDFLSKYVGKENAVKVNALFESKLLLKNQKAGYITWAKNVSGISQRVKMDMLSKIERMDKFLDPAEEELFLNDLAATRLGVGVTQTEAKNLSDLSSDMVDTRAKANENGIFPSETERLKYGLSVVSLENYFNDLKTEAKKPTGVGKITNIIKEIPGTLKSLVASLDNSFWGRQGIKTLLDIRTSHIWLRNFLRSWGDIGRELKGKDAMDLIRADIYSRPNALNGKYTAGRYGLDVLSEEAYPSQLPEKIPVLKRLFKASESAYNGGALRMRADLADRLIRIAEKQGVNTLDPEQAIGMGNLISSLTGRGSLGKGESIAKELNVLLFSAKFLKSNIDTLTMHRFDSKATKFTRREAAKNLLSITLSIASILTLAKLIDPDSVDEDPRSTNFGKVKVFGHFVDITGGMSSLVTLASRLAPSIHEGKLSFWTKSSTGKYTDLLAGEYGQPTALDVLENFLEGKLSPVAGIVRDIWKGENFQGEKVTPTNLVKGAITPISIQNFKQLKDDPKTSSLLGAVILEGLGLSTSVYNYKSDWSSSTSKEMKAFKKKVGEERFKKANEDYNRAYNAWYERTTTKPAYKKLSDTTKAEVISKAKDYYKQKIFKSYHFKYKMAKPSKKRKQELKRIKSLAK